MSTKGKKVFAAMSPHQSDVTSDGTGQAGGYHKKGTVFVAMSGGVDSSVAALLLKNQGYDTVGVFMRCFNLDGCAERDAEDARRVAEKLQIPFYVWDFEEEYKKRVVDYMIDGYRRGITPNPDVMCNREIKFGLFMEKALSVGADYVATGHYVRLHISANNESSTNRRISDRFGNYGDVRYSLMTARDASKDQSYFLWTLTQKQLAHCLFPIGDYLKSEVRRIAREAGLPTADKKDSQGICFLGKVTLGDFLKEYIPEKRGSVISVSGEKLGEHDGAHFYTIGQRHGLGVATGRPSYVADKDIKTNTVTVAEGSDNPALYHKEVGLAEVNLISPDSYSNVPRNIGIRVLARVRYRQPLAPAILTLSNSREWFQKAKLVFDRSVKFVAPGQSAVFYLPAVAGAKEGGGLEMLGGGVIV